MPYCMPVQFIVASPLLQEVFILKSQHFQIPLQPRMADGEPLCGCVIEFLFLFLFILFIFFYSLTHKPIPVDMSKRIQNEYKDLYILHGCVFFVTYTYCFCILVFFLHGTGIKIIIIFKNNNDIFNNYSSCPNGL